ncbi:MAG: heavy metal translocating P-type ATPase [Gammaproteobacteria bacterium]|nr:heavy metal translocating P-type ATPase [Gammaproteobacteria bacterium]MBU1731404.1 heavy metal translocating P-type ATPase [Gammaproteobacteria bacterium]MBU1892909.1 heavy metal translocating P-type ATPase [Gammaproteobacteria bacterium]
MNSPAHPECTAVECFHCGQPVPENTHYPVEIEHISREMCCRGCQAVAQAIVAGGLADYYRHRTAKSGTAALDASEVVPEWLRQAKLYDLPEVQHSFVRQEAGEVREASLILEGIVCAACVWLNEHHISSLSGVLSVEVNYSTHRARVRWDNARIQLSEILHAVAAIGYTAHPFDPGRQEQLFQKERKTALRRLFIAGIGMMQVMMYAVPMYLASDDGTMPQWIADMMRWASLALTLPVVVYSAWPFFLGAWRDLKVRQVGMDVPVALGIGAAFLASVYATLLGEGEVYFDSVAMFVFFLLSGRFLEMGARRKAADAAEKLVKLQPAMANRLVAYPDSWNNELVAVSSLSLGEYVLIRPGESVPADGLVEQGASEVDESLLTGESRPVAKRVCERLIAGTVNVGSALVMKVDGLGQDTVLSGIVRLLDRAMAEKPALAQLADRVAGWFVLVLLLIAAATGVTWYFIEPARAFWITVAVLVVSCPCALSLATPAALTTAIGSLTRLGLLTTRGHALETLARVTHFVFDKTGTLTYGKMSLLETLPLGGLAGPQCLRIAAALEHASEHAIARALSTAAEVHGQELETGETVNFPGSGVEGVIAGRRYRLGRLQFAEELCGVVAPEAVLLGRNGATTVALADEYGWLALFVLDDTLRPDASEMVAGLQQRGKTVVLLSGDQEDAAQQVAKELGIPVVRAAMTPQGKLDYVHELQCEGAVVAMVGDGVNDAPVLAAADVSIAMGGGTQVARASADMILLSEHLLHLHAGLDVAVRTRRIIRQNLTWAFAYNLLAIPLAALGYITPWMAGIGMSASSLLVVLNALRLVQSGAGAAKIH